VQQPSSWTEKAKAADFSLLRSARSFSLVPSSASLWMIHSNSGCAASAGPFSSCNPPSPVKSSSHSSSQPSVGSPDSASRVASELKLCLVSLYCSKGQAFPDLGPFQLRCQTGRHARVCRLVRRQSQRGDDEGQHV